MAGLTNAEDFEFTTLTGVRLALWGASMAWNDEVKTGIVEKQVVKRAGALHQKVGAPPIRTEFRCAFVGKEVTAQYNQLVDAILEEPEGFFTHPRLGSYRAVCEVVTASETPGEAKDLIEFTIKFSETGLHDPPKPSATAKAQTAVAQSQVVTTLTASSGGAIATTGAAVQVRATGYLVAMQAVETGLGALPDVDASLAELATAVHDLDALDAPKVARRAAVITYSAALESRNRLLAGRPPLIRYRLASAISLGNLCQQLYGSDTPAMRAEILRLNRIRRPFHIAAGSELLLSDPSFSR